MESFGNFFDEEWSLSKMFVADQDYDHFSGQQLLSSERDDHGFNVECPTIYFPSSNVFSNAKSFVTDKESLAYVSDNINPNYYHFFSQESSICSSGASTDTVSLPYPCHESFQLCPSIVAPSPSNDACDQSIAFCMMDEINNSSLPTPVFPDDAMSRSLYLKQDVAVEKVKMENSLALSRETPLKRNSEMRVDDEVNNEKTEKNPKKRSRPSKDNKSKKNVQPKKNQKMNDAEDCNNNNGERNGQSSSSCSSDDNLTGSQDMNGAITSNGKTRASRGTATDPQSLYARKRRERINERLRILQNLVPNGTKVDISTMLEEAVEYVKFLKLQIQLLSSDDMWMYAPIAYNGMDMGLYQNIAPTL
ncbi:hypothetical protein L2E82_27207 [Cichorium intybus]|uniref:Uncharacterized protein n=1 Tax=Cichorium intybus TaxID=13427 RepID=A0ACB9CSM5_CICIN|nr:hypothetical protein L2E82_27207 [Cichorium intybus]